MTRASHKYWKCDLNFFLVDSAETNPPYLQPAPSPHALLLVRDTRIPTIRAILKRDFTLTTIEHVASTVLAPLPAVDGCKELLDLVAVGAWGIAIVDRLVRKAVERACAQGAHVLVSEVAALTAVAEAERGEGEGQGKDGGDCVDLCCLFLSYVGKKSLVAFGLLFIAGLGRVHKRIGGEETGFLQA